MSNDPKIEVVITGNSDGLRKATNQATESLDDFTDKASASSSKVKTHWEGLQGSVMGIRAAWLQVAGVVAAGAWLIDGAKQALDGEKAMNKLRIQVEGLGLDYSSLKGHIEGAIDATSRYALVQDDDVAAVLQQLIFLTGDYAGSVENLNLIFDLAYQKNISHAEAAGIVGKAMTGNLDAVVKLIPEFKGLEDTLGKNATQAEKAALAMESLRSKVERAADEMTEHEKKVAEVTLAYNRLKEGVGGVGLEVAHMLVMMSEKNLKAPLELLKSVAGAIDSGAAWANPNAGAGEDNTRHPYSMTLTPGVLGKNLSDTRPSDEIRDTLKIPDDGGSLQAFILGSLDVPEDKLNLVGVDVGKRFASAIGTGIEATPSFDQQLANMDTLSYSGLGSFSSLENSELKPQLTDEELRQGKAEAKLWGLHAPAEAAPEDEFSQAWLGYEQKLAAQEQYNSMRLGLMAQAGATEEQLWEAQAQMEMDIAKKKRDFQLSAATQTFGGLSNIMQNLMTATGSRNKAMFKAMQAAAIGEAVINTFQGATKALATVPYPFNFVAAASVVASGMAQVAKIRAQTPEGGGGAAIDIGGAAAPEYHGGSPNAYPVPTRTEEKAPISLTLIVQTLDGKDVNWPRVMEENILPTMEKISGDGNRPINIRVAQA